MTNGKTTPGGRQPAPGLLIRLEADGPTFLHLARDGGDERVLRRAERLIRAVLTRTLRRERRPRIAAWRAPR